jgi:hypothetical protein
MKTICLLLLTISWTGLMRGIVCGSTSSPVSQQASPESAAKTVNDHPGDTSQGPPRHSAKDQKNGKHADGQRDSRYVSGKNLDRSRANLVRENRPRQFENDRERSTSGNVVNLHEQGFDKSGIAKGGLTQNEIARGTVPVRPPSVVRPTAATLANVRHHGPNPATVSGLGNRTVSNTGSINGTGKHRRP